MRIYNIPLTEWIGAALVVFVLPIVTTFIAVVLP